ncbi:MAG: DUF177 domain-containing protein [Halobacteriovoraceae bacterium]|jgi:uncharacterized protein|nr:DUF177 domain-containing protein [Halobacteriovoraceae bacterium]MBT5094835.1 DUF177 domain-containing protein [Halobacteriovoraceae bacterium]
MLANSKLEGEIQINDFSHDSEDLFELDGSTGWVADQIRELENIEDAEDEGKTYNPGKMQVTLKIQRKSKKPLGEHLVIRGKLNASYMTPCVRCLELTAMSVEAKFSSCFLHNHLEEAPEFKETASVFADNEEMDLYFYDKGQVDLKEMVHEQLFMEVDQLALHDPDCKGLCGQCGVNLNTETCAHSQES